MPEGRILVVGSINMDVAARVARLPAAGETVTDAEVRIGPGGKGANQAVAAARLGGRVAMCGRVGDDENGRALLASFRESAVDVEHVTVDPEAPTGVAIVWVDGSGENRIVVAPGANRRVGPEDARRALGAGDASILVVQMEIPLETVTAAVEDAAARGMTVVLDPAPASRELPDALLSRVDVLTPNEGEATALAGLEVMDVETAGRAARILLERGARSVVVKLGKAGCLVVTGGERVHVAGVPVKAVDSTAAGDCFTGALAVALTERRPLVDAARWANAAAALSVTRVGAQASLPLREEVDAYVRQLL